MNDLPRELERRLRGLGTPERAAQERRYLKSALTHLGVTVPVIRREAKAAARRHTLDRVALLDVVARLWAREIHELRMAAVELLVLRTEALTAADLAGAVEPLLRGAKTWALVDSLAAHVAGSLAERFPACRRTLDRWAKDPDFWIRRSALLALLLPLCRGAGDFARFCRYADGGRRGR
jgi:3-methyladenine DNA glycosylase AlkD